MTDPTTLEGAIDGLIGREVGSARRTDDGIVLEFGPAGPGSGPGGYRLRLHRCSWRIEFGARLGAGEDDTEARIGAALERLTGRVLTAVSFESPSLSTTFTFGDARLITFAIHTDPQVDGTEQWHLTRPDHRVLRIGPGSRWHLSPADPPPGSSAP